MTGLLDRLEQAGAGSDVSVQDVLDAMGERSILPVVLAISMMLISPLSGIPGLPTLSAIVILLIMGQAALRRPHLWLPDILRNRRMDSARFTKAIGKMRKPAGWVDRHSHPRLRILTAGPLRGLTYLLCMCVPLVWPMLELLPFVTTTGALALALMTFGLFTRDGLYVLFGYGVVGGMATGVVLLVQAGT
ncbi:exopolysaccharide biosynthesis protein [Tateyamaria sp. SN6-1]|uniref:exopolysaccharide biosynthesis protein n=1 Tax=Tateyamaria sp. SN6-1 TaxID=3092148 RepID=UPI0039F4F041